MSYASFDVGAASDSVGFDGAGQLQWSAGAGRIRAIGYGPINTGRRNWAELHRRCAFWSGLIPGPEHITDGFEVAFALEEQPRAVRSPARAATLGRAFFKPGH